MRQVLDGWTAPDEEQERLRRAFLTRLADGPQALRREGRPSHLTASAVVLDARRTTLLVHHRRTGLWLQPGGHVEDGDASLADAALREAVEETGLVDLRLLGEQPVHLERHRQPVHRGARQARALDQRGEGRRASLHRLQDEDGLVQDADSATVFHTLILPSHPLGRR